MTPDECRNPDRQPPERRHNTRGRMTLSNYVLVMGMFAMILFWLWLLVYA